MRGRIKRSINPQVSAMQFDSKEILSILDRCCDAFTFPMLDNGYVYLAATRLSVYRSTTDWAMAFEVFGFSPRAGLPDTHTFRLSRAGYTTAILRSTTLTNRLTTDILPATHTTNIALSFQSMRGCGKTPKRASSLIQARVTSSCVTR
jgi:hypothetical protein